MTHIFSNALTVAAGVVGTVTGIVLAIFAVLTFRRDRARPEHLQSDTHAMVSATLGQLAYAIRVKWRTEENLRRIHDPFPLPVRWVNANEELFDHWSNIIRDDNPLTPRWLNLSGNLNMIVDTFRATPSMRLVVLGGTGSGKSVLTIRFVIDYLDRRDGHDHIPVVLNIGTWNPNASSFNGWLIQRLVDQHPGLARAIDGNTLAEILVNSDYILPVLDGFDEIAESLRPAALMALNLTTGPLLLTSRPDEYKSAVNAADVLTRAAAISLLDLTLDDLADYLPLTTRKTNVEQGQARTKWDEVINLLRHDVDNPQTPIVQSALATPLMVGLARVIYSDAREGDPIELFDNAMFPSEEAIEDHLLDAFIPAAYKYSSTARQSKRLNFEPIKAVTWLTNIATHMTGQGTRDIAWWELRDIVPRPVRMFVGAVVGTIGAGVLLGLVFNPWIAVGLGATFGAAVTAPSRCRQPIRSLPGLHGRGRDVLNIMSGGLPGSAFGTLLGAWFGGSRGLVANALAKVTAVGRYGPVVELSIGVAAGLGFATAGRFTPAGGANLPSVLVNKVASWARELVQGFILGLVAGLLGAVALGDLGGWAVALACILSVALVVGFETAVDIKTVATATDVLKTDRQNALYMLALFGLTVWLAVTWASWHIISHGRSTVFGFGSGLMDGLGFCLGFTAWGNWLVMTQGWLVLTGRLPRRMVVFLEDAHLRGILRQSGAVYQFRHARLQDRLSMSRSSVRTQRTGVVNQEPGDAATVQITD